MRPLHRRYFNLVRACVAAQPLYFKLFQYSDWRACVLHDDFILNDVFWHPFRCVFASFAFAQFLWFYVLVELNMFRLGNLVWRALRGVFQVSCLCMCFCFMCFNV